MVIEAFNRILNIDILFFYIHIKVVQLYPDLSGNVKQEPMKNVSVAVDLVKENKDTVASYMFRCQPRDYCI